MLASFCSTLVVPPEAFVPLLPQAARMPGNGDRGSSDRCALEQLPPGEVVGHSAPSVESTTNVESGLHEISLGACSAAPGSLFWT